VTSEDVLWQTLIPRREVPRERSIKSWVDERGVVTKERMIELFKEFVRTAPTDKVCEFICDSPYFETDPVLGLVPRAHFRVSFKISEVSTNNFNTCQYHCIWLETTRYFHDREITKVFLSLHDIRGFASWGYDEIFFDRICFKRAQSERTKRANRIIAAVCAATFLFGLVLAGIICKLYEEEMEDF
jgi:hypothetical protein